MFLIHITATFRKLQIITFPDGNILTPQEVAMITANKRFRWEAVTGNASDVALGATLRLWPFIKGVRQVVVLELAELMVSAMVALEQAQILQVAILFLRHRILGGKIILKWFAFVPECIMLHHVLYKRTLCKPHVYRPCLRTASSGNCSV